MAPERATPPPSKRKRGEGAFSHYFWPVVIDGKRTVDSRESSVKPASNAAAAKPKPEPRPRTIRYPIEDLELDAGSTFDGRLLRRVNTELPPLPTKPTLETDLGVPQGDVEAFLLTWSFLNVFGCASSSYLAAVRRAYLAQLFPRFILLHPRRLRSRPPTLDARTALHPHRRNPRRPPQRSRLLFPSFNRHDRHDLYRSHAPARRRRSRRWSHIRSKRTIYPSRSILC